MLNLLTGDPTRQVLVANGYYEGQQFPTPAQVLQFAQIVLNAPVPPANQEACVKWVYKNLASSSFFDHLWEAFNVLSANSQGLCEICGINPCLALVTQQNQLKAPWKSMRRLHLETSKQRRYRAYKMVSGGHFRKVIPACWLFSIRVYFPGGDITGYLPPELVDDDEDDNQ